MPELSRRGGFRRAIRLCTLSEAESELERADRAGAELLFMTEARYPTPLAALDGRDGLMLDISGVAHLFGGEAALIEDCLKRLGAQRITLAAGVAGNPRGAWALARFSAQKIAPDGLGDKAFAKRLFKRVLTSCREVPRGS